MALLSRDDDDRMDAPDAELLPAVPVPENTALAAMNKSEIQAVMEWSQTHKRSMKEVVSTAVSLATTDEETAESCMYALPRTRKVKDAKTGRQIDVPIEGPSVRLAEIVAYSFPNAIVASRIIDDDGKFLTAQGVFIDAERNIRYSIEVKRRVTNKDGVRYNDDMVGVTANAATSIAYRNVVFKAIPRALVNKVYNAARQVAVGNAQTLAQKREAMLAYFAKMHVSEAQVLSAVNAKGIEDIDLDKLALLKGMVAAIKNGEAQVDDMFPPISPMEAAGKAPTTESTTPPAAGRGKAKAPPPPASQGSAPAQPPKPAAAPPATGDVAKLRQRLADAELAETDAIAVLQDNSKGNAWLKPGQLLGDLLDWQLAEIDRGFDGFAKAVRAYVAAKSEDDLPFDTATPANG